MTALNDDDKNVPGRRMLLGRKSGDKLENLLPDPPPWRDFGDKRAERGDTFVLEATQVEMVDAALYLRRPLLVRGKPGTGKSSLAYAVAKELGLGKVLVWPINTRSTLQDGLYRYDAIGRLQDAARRHGPNAAAGRQRPNVSSAEKDIGRYIRLGPLGTAILGQPSETPGKYFPRVLLIDEIDKSDVDLPNDLLNIFEEGEFEIPELSRLPNKNKPIEVFRHGDETSIKVERGHVHCNAFPLVILTSNDERVFPPAFLRRCLVLEMGPPDSDKKLAEIVTKHFPDLSIDPSIRGLVTEFLRFAESGNDLATDQLLNAVYLVTKGVNILDADRESLKKAIFRSLTEI